MQLWKKLIAVALLLLCCAVQAEKHRYPMPGALYALGDVHGAYDELVQLLTGAGLIDEDERWIGGSSYLVSVGDLLDRGDHSRQVVDLLRRLQKEAKEVGGRVYVLLGNHEQMNLMGELDYVTPGEFANYQDLETSQIRRQQFERFSLQHPDVGDTAQLLELFEKSYPPGYLGHRRAFAKDGEYGAWLLQRPTLLVIGRIGFVHGGLSGAIAGLSSSAINQLTEQNIRQFVTAQQALQEAGSDLTGYRWYERLERAKQLAIEASDESTRQNAMLLYKAGSDPLLNSEGPLWYRGNVLCHPLYEQPMLKKRLAHLNIDRLIVGHTPTPNRRVTGYLGGLVIDIDTGMNSAYYQGKPTLLQIGEEQMRVFSDGHWQIWQPQSLEGIYQQRSYDEWESLLSNAAVVSSEEVGEGVTRPLKVTLQDAEGQLFYGLFKSEDVRPSQRNRHHQLSDSYRFELAAYTLSRLLQLDEIPPTVERQINGRSGSLQLWIDNLISENQRLNEGLYPSETCVLSYQHSLMNLFDILIHNDDRTRANMLYDKTSWKLWWIDHSRAFRTLNGAPQYLQQAHLIYSPLLQQRLHQLSRNKLQKALGRWLDADQLRALNKRRDLLLDSWHNQR